MSINFISSKDSDETHNLRAKSNNTEIITGNKTNKIIDELFCLQKTSLRRKGGSYIDSLEWLKNKTAPINPKNKDDNFFQYALTAALIY